MNPSRQRLPRQAKLRGRVQFTGSFASRRQGKFFVVSRRSSPPGGPARLGIVIGRQTAPLAVVRSRMKRLIREVFRRVRQDLGSVDVVVRVRRPAAGLELAAARNELKELLRDTS
ncbi:MAG TPA: ribonuclease P protein component [Burkholderiales bacterium]|nr:ribonuclease P protein component [Burkholderiales bacterium]